MTSKTVNRSDVDACVERIAGHLNGGALALMISIGHRTGLFDALAQMQPSACAQIAEKTGLNERYVREWLGAMVTGRIVEYDADDKTYHLPAEYAACLTRAATSDNMATIAQFIGLLGTVEDKIVECFHNGGGVPYSAYGRFHEIMAEDSGQTVVTALTDHILPLVDGLTDRLSKGIDVFDVGCGAGRALNHLAKHFPKSRFVGWDFSEEAIGTARSDAKKQDSANVSFEVKDVAAAPQQAAFDLITAFDAIHDQAYPDRVLANIAASLRPSGVFLMQDIAGSSYLEKNLDHPVGPFLYTISCMHCMTVSLALDGAGLGTMWGVEKARTMLAEAGFVDVRVEKLDQDPLNYFYIATR